MASDRHNLPLLPILEKNTPGHRSASRPGWLRAGSLLVVHVVFLVHVAHYISTRWSISPIEPSESMYAIELGYVNAGTIFFALAILSTAVFGRFFCGWGCHLVALQDLAGLILRRCGLRPLPLRTRCLRFVPYVLAGYMFLWPTLVRLWYRRQHPGFSNHLLTGDFWATFPEPGIAALTLLVCSAGTVFLLGNKGFCTFACPYGAFFAVADQFAIGRIRVTDACHQCGKCTAACTSNVLVHEQVREFGMVTDTKCMKCMDCVASCPNEALYYGFGPRASTGVVHIAESPLGAVVQAGKRSTRYDLSFSEEMISLLTGLIVTYAIRGLYDGPPLLLAVAMGVMTGYFTTSMLRLRTHPDVRIQRLNLRIRGRLTNTGYCVLTLGVCWLGLIVHSVLVQACRHHGRSCLDQISITWPQLLEYHSSSENMIPIDFQLVESAHRSFLIADRFGIVNVTEIKVGLAWTSVFRNNFLEAEEYLKSARKLQPDSELIQEMLAGLASRP